MIRHLLPELSVSPLMTSPVILLIQQEDWKLQQQALALIPSNGTVEVQQQEQLLVLHLFWITDHREITLLKSLMITHPVSLH